MPNPACASRLQKELRELYKNPLPGLRALPSPSNLLEWHYVLEGASDSDYAGGYYHGKITFPPSYPFKPPSIQMLTPSGRFEPGARICLSISDFHPESWNPLWGVGLILLGVQSFFYENTATTGALHNVPAAEKRRLAAQSLAQCVRNPTFRKLFPELVELAEGQAEPAAGASASAARGPPCGGEDVRGAEAGAAAADPGRGLDPGAQDPRLGWRELLWGAGIVVVVAVGLALVVSLDTGVRTL